MAPSPSTTPPAPSTTVASSPTTVSASAEPPAAQPPPGAPPQASAQRIAELLTSVPVVAKLPQVPGYERSCSPGKGCVFGPAWTDTQRTGCDTRNRVLAAQLTDVVFKPGTRNCKVVTGVLHDPYTGATLVFDNSTRADIEIDHVFALGAAWDAGAAQWSYERRVEFANDTDNLLAVSGAENQHKSDNGPGAWLPPNRQFTCRFIEIYLSVAAKYQLAITQDDKTVAETACPG